MIGVKAIFKCSLEIVQSNECPFLITFWFLISQFWENRQLGMRASSIRNTHKISKIPAIRATAKTWCCDRRLMETGHIASLRCHFSPFSMSTRISDVRTEKGSNAQISVSLTVLCLPIETLRLRGYRRNFALRSFSPKTFSEQKLAATSIAI